MLSWILVIDCFLSTVVPGLTPPALKDLSNLLNSVMDWHALGVKLGVKSHELEAIQRNYPHDTTRCKHEMLARCLRSANPPTWRDIRDALCQMEEHASADKIWKKHLQPSKGIYIARQLVFGYGLDVCTVNLIL